MQNHKLVVCDVYFSASFCLTKFKMSVFIGCLIEQLTEEKYECMVCCEVIRVMAPVWSCQSCFHVFHLNCIKKWARSPASQADGMELLNHQFICGNYSKFKLVNITDGSEGWRCPACQHVTQKGPNAYTCFCGRITQCFCILLDSCCASFVKNIFLMIF